MREMLAKTLYLLTPRERLHLGLLLVAMLAMGLAQTAGVAAILPFMELIMDPDMAQENQVLNWFYRNLGFPDIRTFTLYAGVGVLAAILGANLVSVVATWLKFRFVHLNNYRLSRRLFAKYLGMPYIFFLDRHSSDLGKNILTEVNQLTTRFLLPLLDMIMKGIMALCILGLLLAVNPYVTLVALIILGGAYGGLYQVFKNQLRVRGGQRLEANRARFQSVYEAFNDIKELKVTGREAHFADRYAGAALKYARLQTWNAIVGHTPKYILESVAFGGMVVLVLVLLLARDDPRGVVPLLSLYALAGFRLMPALQEMFKAAAELKFHQAVLDRIHQDLSYTVARSAPVTRARPQPLSFQREVRLDSVSLYYPGSHQPALDRVSLTVPRNSSVALVGATGSGKTTLGDVILGLLAPTSGQLLVDDVPITEENARAWQQNLGYVPQEIYLADDTVAANIAFGLPEREVDPQAVEHAARIADIHDFFVQELPQGYETYVGERGVRLSGGQRQRIGIARALYHDPQVLVLDEATSSLDGVTEEHIFQAMANLAREKTLVIIAHRLATVRECDRIYMLDRGKVVAQGGFQELLEENERFRAMARAL